MVAEVPYRIGYVGAGGSGRSSSVFHLLRSMGRGVPKSVVMGAQHAMTLTTPTTSVNLLVAVDTMRGFLHYSDPLDQTLDKRLTDEIERLKTFDGFVFVIDSREFRMEAQASVAEFLTLRRDLMSRGVRLEDRPVMFQANYRDQPDACHMRMIREQFSLPICEYSETVASEGRGVLESLTRLTKLLIEHRSSRG